MRKPIYLDYMATTPVDPKVAEVMADYLTTQGCYGNPSSAHAYGDSAGAAVIKARQHVAGLINAEADEIIFTAGATEANNLAIFGVAYQYQRKGKHIITCRSEHKAVLACTHALEKQGFTVTYLDIDEQGLIDLEQLQAAITPQTILISLMHVNNEIGVIQDVAAIGQLARQNGIIFHVDGAQSLGKIDIDVRAMNIDLMSFSAHKLYGPKGSGALFRRMQPKLTLHPYLYGGGQEQGLRSGTLATHQIVGFGEAARLAKSAMATEAAQIKIWRDQLWERLKVFPNVLLNGSLSQRVPHNLNISLTNLHGEALLVGLRDLAISTGSACNTAGIEPSHVITALGRNKVQANASLRISLGRFTTAQEMTYCTTLCENEIARLSDMTVNNK